VALVTTYRRRLYERALERYGFITTRDADELGVPPVELAKIAQRGGLEHVAYGLYRFPEIPRTERDQFMEAVLRVGPDAYLTHDAVLAFNNLGLVNPRRIRVATPRRARPRVPDYIEIVNRQLDPSRLTTYEGVPATTVAQALLDCRQMIMTDRLLDAVKVAASNGLLTRQQVREVTAELEVVG
jgi:predicted transcriptional regulator of viral defense system